jgi:hypothetical protein
VKPGAGSQVITNTANKEIDKLMRKDIVVVWGGSNVIGTNASTDSLRHISNCVKNRRYTIMIMNTSQRYDLITLSCVNSEVKVFNRKLHKRMNMFDHTKLVDMNLNRENFTQHGLHMTAEKN